MTTFPRGWAGAVASLPVLACVACGTELVDLSSPVPQRLTGATQFSGEERDTVQGSPSPSPPAAAAVGPPPAPVPSPSPAAQPADALGAAEQPEEAAEVRGGCDKLDLLVVVERSLSMLRKQRSLVDSLPDFIRGSGAALGISDVHAMVVDTDASAAIDAADCNRRAGAGRVLDADGDSCGLPEGQRYLAGDALGVADAIGCLAQVGSGSIRERQAETILHALAEVPNEAGRCNAGFLRDDALLVVLLVTDEDDTRSAGEPSDWRADLVAARPAGESALVSLGLLKDGTRYLCDDLLFDSGELLDRVPFLPSAEEESLLFQDSVRLFDFTSSLQNSVLGDVCAPDYSAFFERALASVAGACKSFTAR